ncbi:MAG: DUF5333 domain-containing protein [Paracoccaceae bacterium]
MSKSFFALILFPLLVVMPTLVAAKPPLREVKEIDDTLYYIAIANEIDEYCDGIYGLRVKAINKMYQLRAHANNLGYSDAEIRAYVESKAEQNRMRKKGEAYLAANGVTYAKPSTFCRLGRKEIARSSAIGIYLKEK